MKEDVINSKIMIILLGDLSEYNLESNEIMNVREVKQFEKAIEIYEESIEDSCYFNIILSDYKKTEDAFKLLKQFLEYNSENKIVPNSSGYPFFLFLENKNFNKKILYSYYEENIRSLKIDSALNINSHNILFCKNTKESIGEKIAMELTSYFFQKDFKKNNIKYNSCINFLFMGNTGCGKSTFINYLLGKNCAFQAISHSGKSFRSITYSHDLFPIYCKVSEGFEVNKIEQKKKIEATLSNNIKIELDKRTHIAFYLIQGPSVTARGIDYSDVDMLLQLHHYKIHYYLIMTKEPNENDSFFTSSKRFFKKLIKDIRSNKKPYQFSRNFHNDILIKYLEEICEKLETRTFSIDLLKGSSVSIKNILTKIKNDLLRDKKIHTDFINKAKEMSSKFFELKINISGETENGTNLFEDITKELTTPFFYLKTLKVLNKKSDALKVIKEAKEISKWRKLFFCYNSKVEEKRKEMFEKIKTIYSCVDLNSRLIENRFSEEERKSWFYNEKYTEKLGQKLIDIYEEEYKKKSEIDKIVIACREYNDSIDEFTKYMNQFLNMKVNDTHIYDIDLIE